jgi:hypothetical protein
MSLFDKFLPDKRKRFASQIANLYRTVKDANPNASEKRIDELSIGELYSVSTMKRKAMLLYHLDKVSDIYELAHAIFSADHQQGKDMVYIFTDGIAYLEESFEIIDKELARLGYQKSS